MFSSLGIISGVGITGIIGLAVLAIVGGPVVPVLSRIAEAILTPLASTGGAFLSSLLKMELDGTIDILQTGQRILALVTFGLIVHAVAVHETWVKVHDGYTLTKKVARPTQPQKWHR